MALQTYEIRPGGGGDYTSLSGFNSGEATDLTAVGDIARAECYSGGNLQSSELSWSGWTTDEGDYLELYVPPAERHAGAWDTNKAYMDAGVGGWYALNFGGLCFRIEGLQVAGGELFTVGVSTPNSATANQFQEVISCIFSGPGEEAVVQLGSTGTLVFRNNLIIHDALTSGTRRGLWLREPEAGNPSYTVQNNTIWNEANGQVGLWTGIDWSGGTSVLDIRNNVAYGFASADFSGNESWGTTTRTNNATLDNTHGGTDGVDLSADPFDDSGAGDFAISVSSALYNVGADLSGTFTDDIAGTTRAQWSIGAFEVAGGDSTPPTLSSPTDAATGETTGSASVSTDEDNGTLYAVCTTSASAPSAAQVKAGQDHTGASAVDAASQAVSGTGAQPISGGWSGLSPGQQYYSHFMHEDAAANQSSVASASGFTTNASSGGEGGPDPRLQNLDRGHGPAGAAALGGALA